MSETQSRPPPEKRLCQTKLTICASASKKTRSEPDCSDTPSLLQNTSVERQVTVQQDHDPPGEGNKGIAVQLHCPSPTNGEVEDADTGTATGVNTNSQIDSMAVSKIEMDVQQQFI
jgi:hypothetical protein